MSKAIAIKAEKRENSGTRSAKKLRRGGMMPGIVYGHRKESISVAVPASEFIGLFRHGAHLLDLQMQDSSETVIIKEVQYNYLGTDPIHVDFTRVDLTERVPVKVSLNLRGTPIGVEEGGVLQQNEAELEIECLVTDIPEELKAKINDLKIGDNLKASDIELPEGAKLISDPDMVIASISIVAEEEEPAEAEEMGEAGAGEPEVITKGKAEDEESEKSD